ncbi:MAG: O-antigen ligase family protein [Gammaproteobacteria bacterium]|nr:O-antigen ligase family protein [Gammaproteobacteria bacterium]
MLQLAGALHLHLAAYRYWSRRFNLVQDCELSRLSFAFLILLGIARATNTKTIMIAPDRYLRWGVSVWALTLLAYALVSPDLIRSLESMRGQVVTPIFAGIVFYCLGRNVEAVNNSLDTVRAGVWHIGVWLMSLTLGLMILTGLLINDPFQPVLSAYKPAYITIGWLTTWLTMLAALLPLAWHLPWASPRFARAIGYTVALLLFAAAWLSVNRMIWLCFGVMFVLYVAFNYRGGNQKIALRVGVIIVGMLVSIGLFYFSAVMRANYYPDAVSNVATMLKQDDRQLIWKAAMTVIAEKPIVGHGFALEDGKRALSEQFSDPWHRQMYRQAHNIVLNYAIQMGVPGALALLCLFTGLAASFYVRIRSAPSATTRAVATCGLMLVVGFFLRNMTDDFFSRHASLLLGALVGMLLSICDWRSRSPSSTSKL